MKIKSIRWVEKSMAGINLYMEYIIKNKGVKTYSNHSLYLTTKEDVSRMLKTLVKEKNNPRLEFFTVTISSDNKEERYETSEFVNEEDKKLFEDFMKQNNIPYTSFGYGYYTNEFIGEYCPNGENNWEYGKIFSGC